MTQKLFMHHKDANRSPAKAGTPNLADLVEGVKRLRVVPSICFNHCFIEPLKRRNSAGYGLPI
jgi:hypothetical protein